MTTIPHFDPAYYYLGSICKYGHDWSGTGQSLRAITNRWCTECARLFDRARTKQGRGKRKFASRIALINQIKLERGCTDCGYRLHPAALHFDHLPGTIKYKNIAQMTSNTSLKVLMAEIAKCEVVCANCHAIRTAKRRNGGDE